MNWQKTIRGKKREIYAILSGKPIKVFNKGDLLRDFTYIDDAVEVVLRVLDKASTPGAGFAADKPKKSTRR